MTKIDIIGKEQYDDAINKELPSNENDPSKIPILTLEEIEELKTAMEKPVERQKELAVKIKLFLDIQIEKEFRKNGFLSDYTLRWVREYNELLDRIEKNLHGEKSISLHLHKVTHAHIGDLIRQYKNIPADKNAGGESNESIEMVNNNEDGLNKDSEIQAKPGPERNSDEAGNKPAKRTIRKPKPRSKDKHS